MVRKAIEKGLMIMLTDQEKLELETALCRFEVQYTPEQIREAAVQINQEYKLLEAVRIA